MCSKSNYIYVNDLKCSHKDPKVNDDIAKWLEQTYGNHVKFNINQGKVHAYLGMK